MVMHLQPACSMVGYRETGLRVMLSALREGLRRGVALAAIALSQYGDRVLSSRAELNAMLASGAARYFALGEEGMSAIQQILAKKIVAVVRLDDYTRGVDVAQALAAGGVTVLEFTLTGHGALEAISATRQALGDAVCVGVGTVLKTRRRRGSD